ncbi:MAG: AMIN domain-containing protein [Gammaproteobacteria bacterium]|nr:AMIN domain-containing protein [Gammaproteobacteria bacterium]
MTLALLAVSGSGTAATTVSVDVAETSVTFNSDAAVDKVEHFVMSDPARLVVDLYGASRVRPKTAIPLAGPFRRLRSGAHHDKIRFVFEAAGAELPAFSIDKAARRVSVSWQDPTKRPAAGSQPIPRDVPAHLVLLEIIDANDAAVAERVRSDALAPIADKWRYQVRIAVRPFSRLAEMRHFLLPRPDRLVLELSGVVLDDRAQSFDLRDGFRRVKVYATPRALRLEFEIGDGPLPRFSIFEVPSLEYIVVAWGVRDTGSEQ